MAVRKTARAKPKDHASRRSRRPGFRLGKARSRAHVLVGLALLAPATPDLAELIVDITSTGSTLRANGLRILDAFGLLDGEPVRRWPNLAATVAVFRIERG